MLEKQIQSQILLYLQSMGVLCWRQNSGAMVGEYKGKRRFVKFSSLPGISDIIGCLHGRLLAIEVKRPGAKATPAQLVFQQMVRDAGGYAIIATSLDEVIHFLEDKAADGVAFIEGKQ